MNTLVKMFSTIGSEFVLLKSASLLLPFLLKKPRKRGKSRQNPSGSPKKGKIFQTWLYFLISFFQKHLYFSEKMCYYIGWLEI